MFFFPFSVFLSSSILVNHGSKNKRTKFNIRMGWFYQIPAIVQQRWIINLQLPESANNVKYFLNFPWNERRKLISPVLVTSSITLTTLCCPVTFSRTHQLVGWQWRPFAIAVVLPARAERTCFNFCYRCLIWAFSVRFCARGHAWKLSYI